MFLSAYLKEDERVLKTTAFGDHRLQHVLSQKQIHKRTRYNRRIHIHDISPEMIMSLKEELKNYTRPNRIVSFERIAKEADGWAFYTVRAMTLVTKIQVTCVFCGYLYRLQQKCICF